MKTTLKNEKFITQIGAGDDFTAFLTHDNSLFVAGYNASNFIGLDITARKIKKVQNSNYNSYYGSSGTEFIVDEPTVVNTKKFKTETITHLSCGSNHISVVTNRSNIYICGLLGTGFVQLGNDKFPKEYLKSDNNFISMVGSGLNFSVFVVNLRDVYVFSKVPNEYSNTGYWMGQTATSQVFFNPQKTMVYMKKTGFEEDGIIDLACGKNHFIILTDQNEIYG